SGAGPGSAHPWYIRSFPPRALNFARFGSLDSITAPFFIANARSVSRSNVIRSKFGSWRPRYFGMSANSGFIGCVVDGILHPNSNPGECPGYTNSPDFVETGAYAFFAESNCAAVNQSA